jgi:ATP-binding cassette subfamily B protein
MKSELRASVLSRLIASISRYWHVLFLSLLLAAGSVALSLIIPTFIGKAVDCAVGKGAVNFAGLKSTALGIVVLVALSTALQLALNLCNNLLTVNVVRDLREAAFRKITLVPLKTVDAHEEGDLVSRVIADVDQIADGLLLGFSQFFTGVIMIIGTMAFLFSINAWIALEVLLLTPLSLFAARFIATRTHRMFSLQVKARGEQTAMIDETIGNEKIVQAFGREQVALARFDKLNAKLADYSLKAIFYSSTTNPVTRFINGLVYALVALAAAFAVISRSMSVGQLTCALSYASQYTKPFNEISSVVTELQNALACAERVYELIDAETETPDAEGAIECPANGDVRLEHVRFSYAPERPLIGDFSLSVKPGQKIAIVGPTGCGKTTMINLLMRFYDVNDGGILVGGEDIRNIRRRSLRTTYGMVLQDTWIKTGTVRDNIKFGKPDATDEEIVAAAKASRAHSFIKRLPDGYDTVITGDGGSLSQGQMQLLCITRVMLSLPPMLILDEATSSIDVRTEVQIQKAFADMMKGRTSFIVAHRLSTIRAADVILVMRAGNIVEHGSHAELIAKKGFYAELYESQFES